MALQYVFISISSTHFLSFYHFCRLSADLIVPGFFHPPYGSMVWVLRPLILLGQLGGGATMIVVKFFRWYSYARTCLLFFGAS